MNCNVINYRTLTFVLAYKVFIVPILKTIVLSLELYCTADVVGDMKILSWKRDAILTVTNAFSSYSTFSTKQFYWFILYIREIWYSFLMWYDLYLIAINTHCRMNKLLRYKIKGTKQILGFFLSKNISLRLNVYINMILNFEFLKLFLTRNLSIGHR